MYEASEALGPARFVISSFGTARSTGAGMVNLLPVATMIVVAMFATYVVQKRRSSGYEDSCLLLMLPHYAPVESMGVHATAVWYHYCLL